MQKVTTEALGEAYLLEDSYGNDRGHELISKQNQMIAKLESITETLKSNKAEPCMYIALHQIDDYSTDDIRMRLLNNYQRFKRGVPLVNSIDT